MKTIEYEERVLLNEADYRKVIEDIEYEGRAYKSFTIENIYLDNDENFIQNNRSVLRIRTTSEGIYELTLKIKQADNSCIEINETVDEHPQIDEKLHRNFDQYKEIARLTTQRIEVEYDDYLLVIDKNFYSDVIDYDLEIEAKSQQFALEILQKYCKKYGIAYDSGYRSKSRRAIAKAKEKTGH